MLKGSICFITLLFCVFYTFELAAAQDSTTVKADSLNAKTDSLKGNRQLEEFKKAFKKLIKLEKAKKVKDPTLKLTGFVLDETRSRTGRTFYELFYQRWEAPENASYYTITISEQPTPARGTQIIITMDYQRLLKFRLQPKYTYIEKVSKQAIAYVYKILKKQSSIEEQLIF